LVRHKDQMPMPSPFVVVLSAEHEAVLTARVCSWRTEFRDRLRAQIVLEAADGASNEAIAEALEVCACCLTSIGPGAFLRCLT